MNKTSKITIDTPVETIKELSEGCKKCGNCCQHGAGFLLDNDIPRIAKFLGISEQEFKDTCLEEHTRFNTKRFKPKINARKNGFGPCVFFDKAKGCLIHEVKPFECRIGICNKHGPDIIEWFNLNYLVNPNDPRSIREWNIKLKITPTIKGGELDDLVKDKEWLKKVMDNEIM